MNRKIIMYLRKSRSDNQFETVEDVLKRHETQLQEFYTRMTGETITESCIYREVVSGETIEDRPLMIKLLKEIENGEVESVIVIEPQRLSRGNFSEIGRISDTFRYSDCKIITPVKTYDLNDKFDRKMFEQELLRGNDYLEYIKDILHRGRVKSVQDGYYIGSKSVFGYDKQKTKNGNILVANADADTVKYIFDTFANTDLGCVKLAKHLSELGFKSATGTTNWTVNMVRNILKNEVYIGYLTYGRNANVKAMVDGEIIKSRAIQDEYIKSKGLHKPLIDETLFNEVQKKLHSRNMHPIRNDKKLANPLAGLIKCKLCGRAMLMKYDYRANRKVSILKCNNFECKCVSSRFDFVEDRVIEILQKELADYKYYIANFEKTQKSNNAIYTKQINKADKELEQLKRDLQNALIKFNRGTLEEEEYIFLRDYTKQEISRLNKLKATLNDKLGIDETEQKRNAIPILENCIKHYYELDVEDRNKLLNTIIDKILYEKHNKDGKLKDGDKPSFTLDIFLKI